VNFLVKHGFDFNLQYSKGIVYHPGADRKKSNAKNVFHEKDYLRKIFDLILLSKKPIVLHNSLMDLVFIYQHLYGPAPTQLQTFLADLDQMWPNGIYDTKYIADYCARTKASYLEFVFRKCQRENDFHPLPTRLSIKFSQIPEQFIKLNYVQFSFCNDWSEKVYTEELIERLCIPYCLHGYCNAKKCDLIHDVDLFILDEEFKAEKKRQRRKNRLEKVKSAKDCTGSAKKAGVAELLLLINNKKRELEEHCDGNNSRKKMCKVTPVHDKRLVDTSSQRRLEKTDKLTGSSSSKIDSQISNGSDSPDQISSTSSNGQYSFYQSAHRAGFDAFMTGFSLAYFAMKNYDLSQNLSEKLFNIAEIRNKISLSGKDFYLTVQCSGFAKHSTYHLEKWAKMLNNDCEMI
uniref:Target of EGR1 protein 1 n=1 Tax=Romanomermis culicivorax TaxID=13658 RepID=A0A915IVU2_ROMCU